MMTPASRREKGPVCPWHPPSAVKGGFMKFKISFWMTFLFSLAFSATAFSLPENMVIIAGHRDCNNYHETCPATAASLHYPVQLAVNQGELFFKEFDGGPGLRRVELGPLPTIERLFFDSFFGPTPLEGSFAFDAQGNMFAIEFGFIPQVDLNTRTILPCAGDGALGDGGDATFGPDGNLYFVETRFEEGPDFFRVLNAIKVLEKGEGGDLCGGTIREVVGGDGTQGFSGDNGPAL